MRDSKRLGSRGSLAAVLVREPHDVGRVVGRDLDDERVLDRRDAVHRAWPEAIRVTGCEVARLERSADLSELEPGAAARALDRLRGLLADHRTEEGVLFDSRAWIVSARVI